MSMLEMMLPMFGINKEDLPEPEKIQAGFVAIAALPDTVARLEAKLDRLLAGGHNVSPDIPLSKTE